MAIKIGARIEKGPHWKPVANLTVTGLIARGNDLQIRQDKPDGTVLYLTGADAIFAINTLPEQCSCIARESIDIAAHPPPPPSI